MIGNALFNSFLSALKIIEPPKESKYLTHLANFGDDEQSLISSWEEDNWTLSKKSEDELGNIIVKPEDEVKSIILKFGITKTKEVIFLGVISLYIKVH